MGAWSNGGPRLCPRSGDLSSLRRRGGAVLGSIAMRATIALVLLIPGLCGCGNSENAGAEEARRLAAAEQKAKESRAAPAERKSTPVPGQAHVPCAQLI